MLKLKLQYFGHLMLRVDSLEKTLMLGGLGAGGKGDDRGWDGWTASPTRWTWVWVNSRSWWWTGRPGVLQFMGLQRVRHDWATELNWTEFSPRSTALCISMYLCFGLGSCCSFCSISSPVDHFWWECIPVSNHHEVHFKHLTILFVFLWWLAMLSIFSYICWLFVRLPWGNVYVRFLNWDIWFFTIEL